MAITPLKLSTDQQGKVAKASSIYQLFEALGYGSFNMNKANMVANAIGFNPESFGGWGQSESVRQFYDALSNNLNNLPSEKDLSAYDKGYNDYEQEQADLAEQKAHDKGSPMRKWNSPDAQIGDNIDWTTGKITKGVPSLSKDGIKNTPTGNLQMNQSQALSDIYTSRPDLQALYTPDGRAINPNDSRIAGAPTLQDWASKYGSQEYPILQGLPQANNGQGQAGTGGNTSTTGTGFTPTGNPQYDGLLGQLQTYLDKLTANGEKINPNIQITPEQIAQFTSQAAAQIHPYYSTQLQAATSQFLGNMGYSLDNYNKMVADEQIKYGRQLDSLASNSADQGFAQSGIRQKQEGQLANDTQYGLDAARNSLMNSAQNTAASFAQTYGGANVPSAFSIGDNTRVLPGQYKFGKGQDTGLYTLDPNIYKRLIGTQQNAEKQATDTLSSQLQSNYLQQQANKTSRSLNTI